jgi:hypothetical protein
MNNNRIITLTCILVFFLAACASSQQAIQQTIAGTQTAMAQIQEVYAQTQEAYAQTQEAKRSPFAEINLEPVLFQSGDLTSPYKSGQIVYYWADGLPQTYFPDNLILQKVGLDISQTFEDDYLMIAVYASTDSLGKAYQDIVDYFSSKPSVSAEVGDQATYFTISDLAGRALLVFTHCSALVVIDITGANMSKDLLEAFAQRIDIRLEPLVCSE